MFRVEIKPRFDVTKFPDNTKEQILHILTAYHDWILQIGHFAKKGRHRLTPLQPILRVSSLDFDARSKDVDPIREALSSNLK